MPSLTPYLGLTLPEFQEFLDSWHEPVNQNMEEIDSWAEELEEALVGGSPTTSRWSSLYRSMSSLAARLDVSISATGAINIAASPEILDLATSSTKGTEASPDDDPRGRFDRSDLEIYEARQSFAGGRFVPIASTGPSTTILEEGIDSGVAIRLADMGLDSDHPVASPQRPAASGLIVGGGSSFISAPGGVGILRLNGSTAPAVFNIDGYLFRVREQIDFDYATQLSPTNLYYVWIYLERVEANYGDSDFLYDQDGGYASKDLRILQSGTAGQCVISTRNFSDTTTPAKFTSTKIGKPKPGDLLVIDNTAAAGSYAIESVDTDTALTIRGSFKADVSGCQWHIQDNHHPNIGAVVTDADPETLPPYQAGRTYIGKVMHNTGADPSNICNFAKGGVWDSGWTPVTAAGLYATPFTDDHDLGVMPTSVEIMFRSAPNSEVYPPIVERRVMTDILTGNLPDPLLADFIFHTHLMPSVRWHASTTGITVRLLNQQNNNVTPVAHALYTNSAGSDVTTGDMRVICRR